MSANGILIEWFDSDAEMVDISRLTARRAAPRAAQLTIDRNEVDQRTAGTQLHEPDLILPPFDPAAENLAVKAQHLRQVDYP